MLYQLSYARVIWKSTGRGGEIKRDRASSGPENERGTGPFSGPVPRARHSPPEGAYMLTMYVYPSTCWSELITHWKGVLASLRPVLTCTVSLPKVLSAKS